MTIDEAIKRLTKIANKEWVGGQYRDADAARLGKRGLKWIKEWRSGRFMSSSNLLPGETEE